MQHVEKVFIVEFPTPSENVDFRDLPWPAGIEDTFISIGVYHRSLMPVIERPIEEVLAAIVAYWQFKRKILYVINQLIIVSQNSII
jgi:hypothetical protein